MSVILDRLQLQGAPLNWISSREVQVRVVICLAHQSREVSLLWVFGSCAALIKTLLIFLLVLSRSEGWDFWFDFREVVLWMGSIRGPLTFPLGSYALNWGFKKGLGGVRSDCFLFPCGPINNWCILLGISCFAGSVARAPLLSSAWYFFVMPSNSVLATLSGHGGLRILWKYAFDLLLPGVISKRLVLLSLGGVRGPEGGVLLVDWLFLSWLALLSGAFVLDMSCLGPLRLPFE